MIMYRLLFFGTVVTLASSRGNYYPWSSSYSSSNSGISSSTVSPYVTMSPPYQASTYLTSSPMSKSSISHSSAGNIAYTEMKGKTSVPNSLARWRTYFLHSLSTSTTTTPSPYIASGPMGSGSSDKLDSLSPTIYWEARCSYPRDSCGIENQPLMGSDFEPGFAVAGSQYQKVMILDTNHAPTSAARLITPYIQSKNRDKICLKLEYLLQDEGIEKLSVIQQDRRETRTIYTVTEASKRDKWRVAKMDIVLREGIVRYILEVRLDKERKGIAMIKSFEYSPGSCSNEYTDDSPQYEFYKRSRLMSKYFELL